MNHLISNVTKKVLFYKYHILPYLSSSLLSQTSNCVSFEHSSILHCCQMSDMKLSWYHYIKEFKKNPSILNFCDLAYQ